MRRKSKKKRNKGDIIFCELDQIWDRQKEDIFSEQQFFQTARGDYIFQNST